MTEQLPLNTAPLPVRLRLEDYLLLDDSGALDAYAKTELIEGEIVFMNAQHRAHARIKTRLAILIAGALRDLGGELEAIVEGSIAVPPVNAPEPDIVITSEPEGAGLIPLESVRLIVEVADTTLQNDLSVKAGIYARNNVPEYWVVDVDARAIHQLWSPSDGGYAARREVQLGGLINAETVDGLAVDTAGI
jgi:Uma2 family endonuclease